MSGEHRYLLGLALRAAVFAIIVNLPSFFEFQRLGGFSPNSFSDVDEVSYLPQALNTGRRLPDSSGYLEHARPASLPSLLLQRPNAVTDYIVGYLGNVAGLTAIELGFVLDIFCCFFCLISFTLLFRQVVGSSLAAEVAALFTLLFPTFLSVNSLIHFQLPLSWLENFVSPKYHKHWQPPMMRGVYTQVSYVGFALVLSRVLRGLRTELSVVSWVISGALSGLLFYIYFFGWGSALALAGLLVFFRIFYLAYLGESYKILYLLKSGLCFLFGHLLAGGLGFWIVATQKIEGVVSAREISTYWFFAPESFALLLILALILIYNLKLRRFPYFLYLAFSCVVAEFILMNLQPLLGQAIAPYHFPTLFLVPLLGGALIAGLLEFLLGRSLTKSTARVCSALIVFVGLTGPIYQWAKRAPSIEKSDEFAELASYIHRNTDHNAVFAMMSFRHPFNDRLPKFFSHRPDPSGLAALSERYVFYQDWILAAGIGWEERVQRELAMGYLYSGKMQLLWPCMLSSPEMPGDIFNLTWTIRLFDRKNLCQHLVDTKPEYSVCAIFKNYELNYLIWEDGFKFSRPEILQKYFSQVWQSSAGYYELWRFNKASFFKDLCSGS